MTTTVKPGVNYNLILAAVILCCAVVLIAGFFFQRQINRLKKGRLADRQTLLEKINQVFSEKKVLQDANVLMLAEMEKSGHQTPVIALNPEN